MKKILLSLCCVCVMVLSAFFALSSCRGSEEAPETTAAPGVSTSIFEGTTLRDNPINFSEWQSINDEIYAYIKIPGTNIDYPILQSRKHDNFYLQRSYKGTYSYRGAIFTQSHNLIDFSDPVNVIYGHNTDKGDMFSQLLYFQNADFFERHDKFYIYQPGRILTYRIFSAHTYDDRHILNSFNFFDKSVLQSFQQSLLSPESLVKNVREGVNITVDDRIAILSTCAEPHSGGTVRYLVNGVLISDERTK